MPKTAGTGAAQHAVKHKQVVEHHQKSDFYGGNAHNTGTEAELEDGEDEQMLERAVFGWVGSKQSVGGKLVPPMKHEMISPSELAAEYGVPRYIVSEYISGEVAESSACKSLPFTLLLVISYSYMVIQHMDAPNMRAVEESIIYDIEENANFAFDSLFEGHKNIQDVNSFVDFWSFLTQGLMPMLYIQEKQWSEEIVVRNGTDYSPEVLHPSEWGMLTIYNRIVGGVRLRQERSNPGPCPSPLAQAFYHKPCSVDLPNAYEEEPELSLGRVTTADESRTTWIWVHHPNDMINEQMLQLELSKWVDDRTTKIEIGIPIYNAEYSIHSLINVNFFFARGGHIWKQIVPQSCYTSWYMKWTDYIWDILYIFCIGWIFVNEVLEVGMTLATSGFIGIWSEYINFFNLIDWISVFTGIYVIYLFATTMSMMMQLNGLAEAVGELRPIDPSVQDVPEVREYMDQLEITVQLVTRLLWTLALYPMIVVFRLFKAFHAQPRLALVSNTIMSSMNDMSHFLVVFSCVFLTFVTSAVVLFGNWVDELSTFSRGVLFCVRLLLGDINFDDMKEASFFLAGIWLMAFIILLSLILLNMLLAIVMDSYTEVKENLGDAETLWAETKQFVHRFISYYKANYVPLELVEAALHEVDRNQLKDLGAANRGRRFSLSPLDTEGEQPSTPGTLARLVARMRPSKDAGGGSDEMTVSASGRPRRVNIRRSDPENLAAIDRQIIFREDLMMLVAKLPRGRKKRPLMLTEAQADEILIGSILEYYEGHRRSADTMEFVRTAEKINVRVRKIAEMHRDSQPKTHKNEGDESPKKVPTVVRPTETCFSTHSAKMFPEETSVEYTTEVDPITVMENLKTEVVSFLHDAQADRQQAFSEVTRLRREVEMLRGRLKDSVASGTAMEGLFDMFPNLMEGGNNGMRSSVDHGDVRLGPLKEEPTIAETDDGVTSEQVHAQRPASRNPTLTGFRGGSENDDYTNGNGNGNGNGELGNLLGGSLKHGGPSPAYVAVLRQHGLLPDDFEYDPSRASSYAGSESGEGSRRGTRRQGSYASSKTSRTSSVSRTLTHSTSRSSSFVSGYTESASGASVSGPSQTSYTESSFAGSAPPSEGDLSDFPEDSIGYEMTEVPSDDELAAILQGASTTQRVNLAQLDGGVGFGLGPGDDGEATQRSRSEHEFTTFNDAKSRLRDVLSKHAG
mmetsp:Transcript_47686/g.103713  ORF Transcript_47686/g.103713 Transcript_47686/m.103713 type:complete len:1192 (-) Transcript_47686:125-3700(-)|eukprot:CAMPEP_0170581264 /NCGR_PEP_ID=MMETSP0224-20130122/6945_1 /TAXON_ID=285029 /ORGANISM="Togula jolla, Strain CCCM 725" /LENGTH=1191 /DNA_ID=CAMNT_0010904385 /DNA_START=30 /DNA_END=3605 /DNA_ORIENTATION=+